MLFEHLFDLARVDVHAAGNDHVRLAVRQIHVAVCLDPAGVAGAIDSSIAIAATSFDEMYCCSRTDTLDGAEMLWSFPLTNGSYTLRLHFAEHTFAAAGQRFFDVEIEDVPVLEDFDIFAAAGNARFEAVVRSFTVEVTDGVLEVRFLHRPGGANPTVMGIEVVSNDADEGSILTTPGKPFLIDVQLTGSSAAGQLGSWAACGCLRGEALTATVVMTGTD